jgi:flagellar protein FliS
MNRGHASRYRQADILAMSPGRQLVALYTRLLSNLKQGLAESNAGRIESRYEKLSRAHQILEELLYTLDHEQGGTIALNLGRLYEYFMAEVLECSTSHQPARLTAVINCLGELLGAWVQAVEETEGAMSAVGAGR